VSYRREADAIMTTEQPATDPWPTIARLTAWLDDRNGSSTPETSLRLLKVTEEAGEVASAWIGMTGQNPRKGVTHTAGDVADELCDVITAAMVALATIKQDPAAHFARKVAQIAALRLDTTGGES
jgi:NTP pyrophosphatase (non-canonical NTP hydrolase)